MMDIQRKNNRKGEDGQALVLIVLAFVVLLGFTALAVDGGMVYTDRRFAQNASDAASLAGGGAAALVLENEHVTYGNWTCTNTGAASYNDIQSAMTTGETAAINRALDNGFSIDTIIADKNGVEVECGVYNNGSWTEKYLDVHTYISKTTDTSFAHFIYAGTLQNQVDAITRVRPRAALALGHAVVSLNPTADCNGNQNGIIFSGNNTVNIDGGGIFSNGCLSGNGTALDVNVTDGAITHAGELETNHIDTFSPAPVDGDSLTMPDFSLLELEPACDAVAHAASPSDDYAAHAEGYIPAGNYTGIDQLGGVVLQGGGLYCLYGDWDVGGYNLHVDTTGTLQGVTIYMIDGDFITAGGGEVHIAAPPDTPDPYPAIAGLLFYMDPENDGLIKLRGNSVSTYVGTIYAPSGRVDIAGTPDMPAGQVATFYTQIISYDIEIGGNAAVDVNFDEDTSYLMPTGMELYK